MEPATVDAISKLGFPLVAALGLGFVIWKLAQWGMTTGDRLAARFEGHVDSLDEKYSKVQPQLDRIEMKIDNKTGCKATEFARQATA